MEARRYCVQCKLNKNINEFERYGRTYRRVCRTCRGAIITGVTTANVIQNVIQQNVSITETVSRTENHVQDIISMLERQQEERVAMIESELLSLREINTQLISACRTLTDQSDALVQQTTSINDQMTNVLEKIDDVIVMCRDPAVQKEITAIGNALSIIHNNTKPKNVDRQPHSKSPFNSPVTSPASSPYRRI